MDFDANILQEVTGLGARFVGARYGGLALLSAHRDAFEHFITAGGDDTKKTNPLGLLPREGGLLHDLSQDPRPIRLIVSRAHGPDEKDLSIHSLLSTPISSGGRIWGNLFFAEKEAAPEFGESDERLAECFAHLAVDYLQDDRTGAETRRCLELLRSAIDDSDGAAMITNPSREIVFWSRGARRLFGFTEREALGQPSVRLLVPPEESSKRRRDFRPNILQKLENGETVQVHFQLLHKDRRKLQLQITISPMCHKVGGIVAVTCLSRFEPI